MIGLVVPALSCRTSPRWLPNWADRRDRKPTERRHAVPGLDGGGQAGVARQRDRHVAVEARVDIVVWVLGRHDHGEILAGNHSVGRRRGELTRFVAAVAITVTTSVPTMLE